MADMKQFTVDKDTFKHYDTDSKLETLYDMIKLMYHNQCITCEKIQAKHEKRFVRLENGRKWNGLLAFIGGAGAGFVFIITKFFGFGGGK